MSISVKEMFPLCVHYPGLEDAKNHVYVHVGDDQYPEYITVSRGYAGCGTQEKRRYAPEKTCHAVSMDCFGNPPYNQSGLSGNSTAWGCSECGVPWSTMGIFRGNIFKHNFKACPLCGARVRSD